MSKLCPIVHMIERVYYRTESGKGWCAQPDTVTTRTIDWNHYLNMTSNETSQFFRRIGGSEHVTRCYTSRGFLPYQVISANPDRSKRIVRTFEFEED
jgi:hypothetical protein